MTGAGWWWRFVIAPDRSGTCGGVHHVRVRARPCRVAERDARCGSHRQRYRGGVTQRGRTERVSGGETPASWQHTPQGPNPTAQLQCSSVRSTTDLFSLAEAPDGPAVGRQPFDRCVNDVLVASHGAQAGELPALPVAEQGPEVPEPVTQDSAVLFGRLAIRTDRPHPRAVPRDPRANPPTASGRDRSSRPSPFLNVGHCRHVGDGVTAAEVPPDRLACTLSTRCSEVDDLRLAISRDHSVTSPPFRWAWSQRCNAVTSTS